MKGLAKNKTIEIFSLSVSDAQDEDLIFGEKRR
jgi:hypothetical protein